MNLQQTGFKEITRTWPKVKEVVSVPHTKRQYNKMVKYLDILIDEVGNDQNHSLASLMETLGALIEAYEERFVPEPTGDPVSVLKMLMEEHGLKQKDMKEIGSQGVVSEVLNSKRKLNARQIQVLAKKFNVSPAVFM
ncbi:MAG: helix-turn-helix domain-containing protein [Candidatus Marinimicrobia bacterium]|nr:helix-turn-helix domain-containing protein [Candidatus Neomarinimicrobiota bacterium]